MIILSTNNLNGLYNRFIELLSAAYVIKPDYIVLNSNIFNQRNVQKTHELYTTLKPILKKISKVCPILFLFSGNDSKTSEDYFNDIVTNDSFINLSINTINVDNGITICGINIHPDNPHVMKDWVRKDGNFIINPVQYGEPQISKKDGPEKIKDFSSILEKTPSISDIILDKIKTITDDKITQSIWFSYASPYGMENDNIAPISNNSYDIRKLAEGEFSQSFQPIAIISANTQDIPPTDKQPVYTLKNCSCIQIPTYGSGLSYVVLQINNYAITNCHFSKSLNWR